MRFLFKEKNLKIPLIYNKTVIIVVQYSNSSNNKMIYYLLTHSKYNRESRIYLKILCNWTLRGKVYLFI